MSEEWTAHEKNVLLTLLQVSGPMIENKLNSEISKWSCIQKKFMEMTDTERTVEELKTKWEEMKTSAKGHLQMGNVSSSEYIKVLAICFGIYGEVDDFDLGKIRADLQVEFQPPKVNFVWDENLGNRLLSRDVLDDDDDDNDDDDDDKAPSKRKRKVKISDNLDYKRGELLEEEFKLKKLNLERELQHQAVRHKMEIEILNLKKKIMLKRLHVLNKKKVT